MEKLCKSGSAAGAQPSPDRVGGTSTPGFLIDDNPDTYPKLPKSLNLEIEF
jgi:hypothetical protein